MRIFGQLFIEKVLGGHVGPLFGNDLADFTSHFERGVLSDNWKWQMAELL